MAITATAINNSKDMKTSKVSYKPSILGDGFMYRLSKRGDRFFVIGVNSTTMQTIEKPFTNRYDAKKELNRLTAKSAGRPKFLY